MQYNTLTPCVWYIYYFRESFQRLQVICVAASHKQQQVHPCEQGLINQSVVPLYIPPTLHVP